MESQSPWAGSFGGGHSFSAETGGNRASTELLPKKLLQRSETNETIGSWNLELMFDNHVQGRDPPSNHKLCHKFKKYKYITSHLYIHIHVSTKPSHPERSMYRPLRTNLHVKCIPHHVPNPCGMTKCPMASLSSVSIPKTRGSHGEVPRL